MYLATMLSFSITFAQSDLNKLEDLYSDYAKTCNNDTDSALYYVNRANQIAIAIKNDNWLSKTNYGLGYCYYLKREESLSLLHSRRAIMYAEKSKNDDILSKAYMQIGQIYSLQNDYVKALKELFHSLKISESNESLNDNTVLTLTYIADIFINEKDTLKALKYYHSAKFLGEKKQSTRLDRVYSNLGVLYMGSKKDSAVFYFENAFKLYQQNKNTYGEINSRINLAVTILNFKSENDYLEALNQLKKANYLALRFDNSDLIFFSYYFLGVYYETAEKNVQQAEFYYRKSLELIKRGYKNEYTVQLYKSLSRISMKQGDYKTAYEFQVKFQELQDSVFSVEKNKQVHEIQTKFDVEQKNNRIQLLNKENEIKSKQQLWMFITAFILMFFLIILAYVYKKDARNQKVIRKKDLLLFEKEKETMEQKQKLNEVKFLLNGQNQERNRISKELHDGVGSSIAAIKMNLSVLNESEIRNKQLNQHINQLTHVSQEIRIISHALSLSIDSGKSMVMLINDLVEIHQFNKKMEIHLSVYPEYCFDELNEFQKVNLYRIFQESFANISKHSLATKVEINCTYYDNQLNIMIEDNGIGFEEETTPGIGIKNIKERIKELNGRVNIDSSQNYGTTLTISIPLKQQV